LRLRRSSPAADSDKPFPEVTRAFVAALGAQLRMLKAQILQFDHMIRAWQRSDTPGKFFPKEEPFRRKNLPINSSISNR
jgi:hypothetical protein